MQDDINDDERKYEATKSSSSSSTTTMTTSASANDTASTTPSNNDSHATKSAVIAAAEEEQQQMSFPSKHLPPNIVKEDAMEKGKEDGDGTTDPTASSSSATVSVGGGDQDIVAADRSHLSTPREPPPSKLESPSSQLNLIRSRARKHVAGKFSMTNKRSYLLYIGILAIMVSLQIRFSNLVFVSENNILDEEEATRPMLNRSKILSGLPDEVILAKPNNTASGAIVAKPNNTSANAIIDISGIGMTKKQQQQQQNLTVVGTNNNGGELSCQALLDRQPSPDQWDIGEAISIKERTFNKFRNGKTHFVYFEGGLVTVLKLAASWGSFFDKKNKKKNNDTNIQSPTYGLIHRNGIKLDSKFNCSFWGGDLGYGEKGKLLLHEVFSYHVDRVLGYNTVPEGKIVSISAHLWSEQFATSLCAHPDEMRGYLDGLRDRYGKLRLLGWLQYYVKIERHSSLQHLAKKYPRRNPKLLGMDFRKAEFACESEEANTTEPVSYHRRDSESSLKFYKYALVVYLALRSDVRSNCWWARHLKNPVSGCVDDVNPFYAPVNVDNDRITVAPHRPPKPWKNPCFVPKELRDQILNISNFTDSFLRSISYRDQEFLGDEDMRYIVKEALKTTQKKVDLLQRQFKGCS